MQKLSYPLKIYIKAVEELLITKGFDRVKIVNTGGSAVRFDLFCKGEDTPNCLWQVHTEHRKSKNIISKEDYKKGAKSLNISLQEFLKKMDELS